MSRKRKRRRSGSRTRGASRTPAPQHRSAKGPEAPPEQAAATEPASDASVSDTAPSEPMGGRRRRTARPSPWPPLGQSLFHGFRAAGSSPAIVAVAFLSALATWALLLLLGTRPTLRGMVILMSPSPVHVFFDVDAIVQVGGTSASMLVSTLSLGAVRAVTFGALMLLIADVLRGEPQRLRGFSRRMWKAAPSLYLIYLAEVALVVIAWQLLIAFLPAIGLLLPLAALHFLVFVPVAIALELVPAREGLRVGFRAARLPGGRHLILVLTYFLVVLYLARLTSPLAPVTPTILGWAFVLVATFVHIGVLGAFVYRWTIVAAHPSVRDPRPGARTAR